MINKRKVLGWAFQNKSLKHARLKRLYKRQPTLRILNFHRVVTRSFSKSDYRSHQNFPKLDQFIQFVEHVAENYHCVKLDDFVKFGGEALSSEKPNIALTFDDGYKDNLQNAVPVLRKYNVPSTIFCTTDSLDGKLLWFQELYQKIHALQFSQDTLSLDWIDQKISLHNTWEAMGIIANSCKDLAFDEMQMRLDALPVLAVQAERDRETVRQMEEMLSWNDLAQLKKSDLVTIGAHTCRHWNLTKLNDEDLRHELIVPFQRISEFMETDSLMIAYPNGRYNNRVVEEVEKAGYTAGFIMSRGHNTADTNRFRYFREYSSLDPHSFDFQMHDFDQMLNQLLHRQ